MRKSLAYLLSQACRMVCVWGVVCGAMCGLSACNWQEAKEVIAVADSIDQNEHVIYDDTAALGKAIRCLDNPLGRVMMSNTLGKAYYYMGRNLEDNYQQVAQAAKCYIEADRLQIDEPIYRGRTNTCMGHICVQRNNDSLALIFYERANEDFRNNRNKWYYAHTLLNLSESYVALGHYHMADSLLQIAQSYHFDDAYWARYIETRGLHFYEQCLYDSALIYFKRGLSYWPIEEEKCYSYLKIMQAYFNTNQMDSAIYYAHKVILNSNNPNHTSNAYYCLMQDAKSNNNAELLSQYSHARTDAQQLLREYMLQDAEALPILEEYMQNPHPLRWVWITLISVLIVCIFIIASTVVYYRRTRIAYQYIDQLSTRVEKQETLLYQELYYRQLGEKLSNIVDRYHSPHKRWNDYKKLKKDLDPWLHAWMRQLDTLPLSEREKVFCIISLVYSHMTDIEIAEYLCYDKSGIRVFKQRISKKLGTTSADFLDFLRNLPVSEY